MFKAIEGNGLKQNSSDVEHIKLFLSAAPFRARHSKLLYSGRVFMLKVFPDATLSLISLQNKYNIYMSVCQ